MSYEDDDGWDDDPEGDGPLTPVASFLTVHEAELARGKLEAEGFFAIVWDAGIVSADPLLALAVRGVKVMVARRHVARAQAVLTQHTHTFARELRPVFRVRAPRGAATVAVAAGLGLIAGVALAHTTESPALVAVGVLAGVAIHALFFRAAPDYCSGCAAVLPAHDVATCPRCLMLVRGTIGHPDERLAAEEAIDEHEAEP